MSAPVCTMYNRMYQCRNFMNHKIISGAILIGVLFLQACFVDGFEQSDASLTIEESLIAGQIIGESLSENNDGLLSSFSEAFAIPSSSNLVDGPSSLVTGSYRNLEDYAYSFNPNTGEHTATFTKRVETDLFRSQTQYELNYIFFDAGGAIIEFPIDQKDLIEAVDFRAVRNGEIESASKRSIYTRTDRLFIDGISESADIMSIDGFHSGEGLFTQLQNGITQLEREYFLDLNYLDIQINKPLVLKNRNFRTGVHGAFSYENTIGQTGSGNGAPGTKIINGTVELNGDGTALLKFREQFDPFRLRLANGDVFDDDEFEGRVTSVNLEEQIFTLSNGQRIQINDPSVIEVEDFGTLEEVALAVESGVRVIAEGEYVHPEENVNLWVATEVEFELESIEDDIDEFDDQVISVDAAENTFTLESGEIVFITDNTVIDSDGDFFTLEEVADALDEGTDVGAEGKFYADPHTGNLIAVEVEFLNSSIDE